MDIDWATVTEHEALALARAAVVDLGAAVPTCPGWDVTRLLGHVGVVHRRTTMLLRTGRRTRPSRDDGSLPTAPSDGVLEWYEAGIDDLVDALRTTDPAMPVWSFHPDHQNAGFWPRRMGHETTIHRVDAQLAAGLAPTTIDATIAVDGIDELLGTLLPVTRAATGEGDGEGEVGTVHVHATDAEGEWLVTAGPEGVAVERAHAKGDVAARGPAAALYRWLWGRGELDDIEVFGDASLLAKLRGLVTR